MEERKKTARTIGGVLAVVTLLILMILSFQTKTPIPDRMFHTLLLMISILLGVDMVRERTKLIKAVISGAVGGYLKSQEEDDE